MANPRSLRQYQGSEALPERYPSGLRAMYLTWKTSENDDGHDPTKLSWVLLVSKRNITARYCKMDFCWRLRSVNQTSSKGPAKDGTITCYHIAAQWWQTCLVQVCHPLHLGWQMVGLHTSSNPWKGWYQRHFFSKAGLGTPSSTVHFSISLSGCIDRKASGCKAGLESMGRLLMKRLSFKHMRGAVEMRKMWQGLEKSVPNARFHGP